MMAISTDTFFGKKEKPHFKRRGLMLDISRNRVPTIKALKRLINALQILNYNELQLYTEHSFAYSTHKVVWKDASPMTPEEVRDIDSYCAEREIELVPNQNSFGHMERWLKHEQYKEIAECPEGFDHPISGWRRFGSTLYPSSESLTFIDKLYAELIPNFKSNQLHIGGDEPWELGKGRSAKRVQEEGKHRVYIEFMRELFDLSKKHGCKPQFWADIIFEYPDLVSELPKGVKPVIWGYEANHPFDQQCKIVAQAGFRNQFYVAPGAGNWNSFSGRLDLAEVNIRQAAKYGQLHGAKGLILTAWGDNGHHQPWLTLYPPLIIAAAAAHGLALSRTELAEQVDSIFFPDFKSGHGAALCALGEIDNLLPQPAAPNSFLHSSFFSDENELEEKLRPLVSTNTLVNCQNALDTIPTEGLDQEIALAVRLNQAAIERALGVDVSEDYQILIKDFSEQWRRHSREGGLAESIAMMGTETKVSYT